MIGGKAEPALSSEPRVRNGIGKTAVRFESPSTETEIRLHDLTGFAGRWRRHPVHNPWKSSPSGLR